MAKSSELSDLGKKIVEKSEDLPSVKGGKSFKSEMGKFNSLKVNESVTGHFMGAKMVSIMDVRTRKDKDLFVLKLRDTTSEEVIRIPCASMLQRQWEDVVDEYGNGDQEVAIQRLRGWKLTINRGPDGKTRDGNQIGQYEIIVWEE